MPTNREVERQPGPPVQVYSPGRHDSEARAAHNMALRVKNQDTFTGKLGEDLTEHINNYIDAAQDYNLDQTNKLAFHNIFDGEAKKFYREKGERQVWKFWSGMPSYTGRIKQHNSTEQDQEVPSEPENSIFDAC